MATNYYVETRLLVLDDLGRKYLMRICQSKENAVASRTSNKTLRTEHSRSKEPRYRKYVPNLTINKAQGEQPPIAARPRRVASEELMI